MTPFTSADGYLSATLSTCAECGRLIPAQVHCREGSVWFEKHCPAHGPQRARVYGDAELYRRLHQYARAGSVPRSFANAPTGCPTSCGLCPEHEQHVCLPILEITDHCNWQCPICLVHTPGTYHRTPQEIDRMLDALLASEGQIDVLNLSGGEPTLHPDFRDIVSRCCARPEIIRVSVSTNGDSLSRDPELLRFLADRHVIVSLQFDGTDDAIYLRLRGRKAAAQKHRLIEACADAQISMSLTATVVHGVNDHALEPIVSLLFQQDHIISVMFQPAAYANHASQFSRPLSATTLPDVIRSLDGAAQGTVSSADFSPLPCSHPACFSLAFYLKTNDGGFLPVKQLIPPDRYLSLIQNRALFGTDPDSFSAVSQAVYDLWSGPAALDPASAKALSAAKRLLLAVTSESGYSPARAFRTAERSLKSIFIHQFMDRHTFDLSRARKCCQVYPQPDGRLIPACVFNCLRRDVPSNRSTAPRVNP